MPNMHPRLVAAPLLRRVCCRRRCSRMVALYSRRRPGYARGLRPHSLRHLEGVPDEHRSGEPHQATPGFVLLLQGLAEEIPAVRATVLLSSDGIVKAAHGLGHGASAQLAATSAGLFSMARNAGAQFDDRDAVGQIVVELDLSQLYVRHVAAGRTKWVHRAANDVMCFRGPARLHRSLGQPGQGPGTRRMAP